MPQNNLKTIIKEAKDEYRKISAISCPAFGNELVYFTIRGWNHLIRKGVQARSIPDQLRRIRLISITVEIVKTSSVWCNHRISSNGTQFWSLVSTYNKKKVTVIVRQDIATKKYFFSVMN